MGRVEISVQYFFIMYKQLTAVDTVEISQYSFVALVYCDIL